jgi:uncharacterized protein YndB with AHSA1/START domain
MPSDSSTARADETVSIERIFDAPRARVFEAWTQPDQIAAWYGPGHVEIPRDGVRVDLRVGGRWEITMLQPGGGQFVVGYDIQALVEPELIVLRSDPMPQAGMPDGTLVRVEFHDLGERTRVALTDGPFPSGGSSDAQAGYNAAFEKLASHLAS